MYDGRFVTKYPIVDGKKQCAVCGKWKTIDDYGFRKGRRDRRTQCKQCRRIEGRNAYPKKRAAVLMKDYGITQSDYEKMYKEQNGLCNICGKPETSMRQGKLVLLSVDHDHCTGQVRGLLCRMCNTLLGCADDDIDILLSCIEYLKQKKGYGN